MKKIIFLILTATLLLTSTSMAFAKTNKEGKQSRQQTTQHQNQKIKSKKLDFKINGSPIIKNGNYKLPISPVTKGMGAKVAFDKTTAIITVTKGTTTIIINLKEKTVTVNGVPDTKSGIFTATNSKKTIVLIKYIAKTLGVRTDTDDDEVVVEVPGLDLPTNVAVTSEGATVVANTLNSSSIVLNATANVIAGQATGGKAELFVGTKLVATDAAIAATDTLVTFTTSDTTPTSEELQAAVPAGGVVTVKLYNASNQFVTSTVANPTLVVDYAAPTITSVTSAAFSVSGSAISINVTGAGTAGDKVDVTKISLYDPILQKTYQLTNIPEIGSNGVVSSESLLLINLGSLDKFGLTDFGSTALLLNIAAGSLLTDAAGNTSPSFTVIQTVPVTVTN